MVTVEIITDDAALGRLAVQWQALCDRSPKASPFQLPAWQLAWWRSFAPGRLHTIAVRRSGRLAGLAALYVEDGTRRLLPVGIGLSDLLDLLVDPDDPAPIRAAMAEAIAELGPDIAECSLEELPEGAEALELPLPPGWSEAAGAQGPLPVLAGSRGIPRRKRAKLNLSRNRMRRRGGHAVRCVRPEAVLPMLDRLVDLHQRRWEDRGEAGVLADGRVRAMLAEALPALAAIGIVRLYLAEIGDRAVGAYLGFQMRGKACAYLIGFDPEFQFESPGTFLVGHAIEEAFGEGASEFDFLRGGEAYKYSWGACDRWNRRRVLSPPR